MLTSSRQETAKAQPMPLADFQHAARVENALTHLVGHE